MRSEAIKPGDVIAGKYRVRTILGRSRGFLVEAFHTEFDQRVVIRVLSPAMCDEKEIERFRREARTLAKLESEHVARIIDVGTLPDGAFYLVRQYLEGIDLGSHLKKSGPLPIQQAVLFVLQAAEAVSQTHVHNIILRELQPSHLFLAQRMGGAPVVKIIDFGTAKLMREAAAPTAGGEMTATAMFGMSPYSSPEILRKAKNVDVRTDVWSLGAILYQCLAGRPPFDGEMAMLMLQIIKEEPPPLSSLRRDITADMNNIIGWSLAKDVDGRFANVHAFAHALTPFAPPEGQVLIQRIGEITNAAKQAKQRPAYAAAPAASPVQVHGGGGLTDADIEDMPTFTEVDEESTGVTLPQAPKKEESLDRTMFMGQDYVPPSPGPPGGSKPQAGAGAPGFGGAAGAGAGMKGPAMGQPGAPQASLLGPSLQLDGRRAAMPSWSDQAGGPGGGGAQPGGPGGPGGGASIGAGAGVGSSKPIPGTVASTVKDLEWPPKKSKRNLLVGVAGACIGVSLLIGLVFFFTQGEEGLEGPTTASTETAASSAIPPADSVALTADPAPSASTVEPATSASAVAPPPSGPIAVAGGPTTQQGGPRPTGGPTGTFTAPKPTVTTAPTPAPTPTTPPDTGGMGTLVAVAVGGSCSFSVNGASKGSGATIKVQVKAGTYSVSCKPATGATKSRSVTVASGGTAMAMFKLQ